MLRYINGDDLHQYPRLRDQMFRHRAEQFKARLGWEVSVDQSGAERDQYDDLNPLYVIWQTPDGGHGGSMRFMATTGRTMVNEHFQHISGAEIRSPLIWECTRFCLAPGAGPRLSAALMLGGAELGVRFGLLHSVGVFDARMVRIYRSLGWSPDMIGTQGEGRDAISVGLWEFSVEARNKMLARAGLPAQASAYWFNASFSPSSVQQRRVAC